MYSSSGGDHTRVLQEIMALAVLWLDFGMDSHSRSREPHCLTAGAPYVSMSNGLARRGTHSWGFLIKMADTIV